MLTKCKRRAVVMVSGLDSGASGSGSSPSLELYIVFYLHPGV